MSRHAADWTWRRWLRDELHKPLSTGAPSPTPQPAGRHRKDTSPTHVPAWPFNQRTTS